MYIFVICRNLPYKVHQRTIVKKNQIFWLWQMKNHITFSFSLFLDLKKINEDIPPGAGLKNVEDSKSANCRERNPGD